ncbi:MAG: hypothetical protein ACLR0P_07770 [Oscillospiraceae bacterium]
MGRLYPAAVELPDSGDTFKGSYATLAAAIGAAQTNDKLVINETIDLGSGAGVEINGKALTLDLNGQTVTHSGAAAITLKDTAGTALAVTDSSSTGNGELKAIGQYGIAIYNLSAGDVKVTAGTVSAAGGYAILNASTGKVTVEGGTLKATTGVAIYNSETGKVTVSGGGAEGLKAITSTTIRFIL